MASNTLLAVRPYSIFMLFILLLNGCAGMERVREEDKSFSQVYETPGVKKDVLYEKVRIWMAQSFGSSKAVIEYENKLEGSIIGNGVTKYPCEGLECVAKYDWTVPFTIRVDTKDDRFRLTYSRLRIAWPAKRDTLGYHEAKDFEMWKQGDFDSIKPVLLSVGENIRSSVYNDVKSNNW